MQEPARIWFNSQHRVVSEELNVHLVRKRRSWTLFWQHREQLQPSSKGMSPQDQKLMPLCLFKNVTRALSAGNAGYDAA